MRIMETKVYQFDELSDKAKESAREWYRMGTSETFGSYTDMLFEPAETAAAILGIEFSKRDVKLMSGKTRQDSTIYFSGFSSQGSGASFEGTYSYKRGCVKAIKAEFGADETLHGIAQAFTDLQKKHGYQLAARISQSGTYTHEMTMDADVYSSRFDGTDTGQVTAEVSEDLLVILRDFARWIYRGLEADYNYQMSDEAVEESISANEYEFTEDGKRA